VLLLVSDEHVAFGAACLQDRHPKAKFT